MRKAKYGGLTVRLTESSDPIERVVVLLHGFGAPGTDLIPLNEYMRVPKGTCFVFPQAPLALPPVFGQGRAWWMIDIESRIRARFEGKTMELCSEIPPGLEDVNARTNKLLDEMCKDLKVKPEKVVLGGFSQGGMLALDVAIRSDRPLGGLVVMSSTLICADEWQPLLARRKGIPCLLSHGRQDPMLPFEVAELLREKLVDAGWQVDWLPFDGGHEIPPPVLDKASQLIASV
jgi:phospholipase/carboxylesterase